MQWLQKSGLKVWRYTKGKCLYMLVEGGLALKYKTFTIRLQQDALEKRKEEVF